MGAEFGNESRDDRKRMTIFIPYVVRFQNSFSLFKQTFS